MEDTPMTSEKETGALPVQTTRRQFLTLLGAAAGAATLAPANRAFAQAKPPSSAIAQYVYVGTYTIGTPPGGSHTTNATGIYVYKMDPFKGDLSFVEVVPTDNPSFLAIDPTKKYLYSVNELGPDASGTTPLGKVSAYRINAITGKLTFLNQVDTHGTYPCHVWVYPGGGYLFAANYGGTQRSQVASSSIRSTQMGRSIPP
jgi:6-phosphogluconolactonase